MKVICIDNKRRPKDFPPNLWIVEGIEVYTVTKVLRMANQPGVLGFVLKERNLSSVEKYDSFDSRRFRPMTEQDRLDIAQAEKLLEELELSELLV